MRRQWSVAFSARVVLFTILYGTACAASSDGAVFGFHEAFESHDEANDFDIHLGDARLPTVDGNGVFSQLRTSKKEPSHVDAAVKRAKVGSTAEKASKGSKKGTKAKIPYDLFRSHPPTPVPMPTTTPPPSTLSPSAPTTNDDTTVDTYAKGTIDISHSKSKRDRDDDEGVDNDSTKGNRQKKAKYAGAVLPPTYNDVKEKYVDPDGSESTMRPSKKLTPHTDKDGTTHYVYDSHENDVSSEAKSSSSKSQANYKKTKRDDYGSSKGSHEKLQKSKQERPVPRLSHPPTSYMTSIHPSTAPPSSLLNPPTERPTPTPAITSNEEPPITSRSLSSFSLSFDFEQTRIPSNAEVNELVAVAGAFLESRLDQTYPGITVLLTISSTNFRLMQPFEVIVDLDVENIPSPPPTKTELDAAVEAVFEEQESLEAFLSVLENLPASNVFQTIRGVSFVASSSTSASGQNRNIIGVSAAAGVLAVLLLVGGGYRQWGKNNNSHGGGRSYDKGMISGSHTVTGETCGATTVATTSKQTRFAFDEAMSLTSRSDWMSHRGDQLTSSDEEEADGSGIRPLFSDAMDEDDAERRVDLLARTAEHQQTTSGDPVEDDLTVDSYVPMRVVDLIKQFSPMRR